MAYLLQMKMGNVGLLSVAREYQDKEKYDEAIMILKMCEKIFPNSTTVLYTQAGIFITEGENQLAVETYKKMLSLDPTNYSCAERIFHLKNIKMRNPGENHEIEH